MIGPSLPNLIMFAIITLTTGFIDSLGFVYASKIWQADGVSWPFVGRSAVCFAVGIGLYWYGLRFLGQLGVNAPELHVVVWFGVTLIGVAVMSGRFFTWPLLEQLVAVCVLAGIGWLLMRVGE